MKDNLFPLLCTGAVVARRSDHLSDNESNSNEVTVSAPGVRNWVTNQISGYKPERNHTSIFRCTSVPYVDL